MMFGISGIVVPLRFKLLYHPIVPIETMVYNATSLFASAGIILRCNPAIQQLYIPHLEVISIGKRGCTLSAPPNPADNPDVWELYEQRDGALPGEVMIYFVKAIVPFTSGCARHPKGKPGVIIAGIAGPWTLAHELGHVLGLRHTENTHQLMYAWTARIQHLPPDLLPSEIAVMRENAVRLMSPSDFPVA